MKEKLTVEYHQFLFSSSFIHLAEQRCSAPICHTLELWLDRSDEFGSCCADLVSCVVLCSAWTLSHANNVFPLGLGHMSANGPRCILSILVQQEPTDAKPRCECWEFKISQL